VFRRTLVISLVFLVWAAPASALDPGRWRETGLTKLPLTYYQGLTHDPAGNWYFDGIYTGLWRTDTAFTETGGNPDVFPAEVKASENYNHIGDISYDGAEGGRIILPVECYYPPQGNTCNTGSFGVADPQTLAWEYYVKLDPAEIPKAMWAEVSPDGQLIWTSAGKDLLAYRAADVNPANAAPAAAPIRAVARLAGAVPPSGITGATFHEGRLFVAGQDSEDFQVWSIDLATGSRQLEIERDIVGESEGLDTFDAAGGTLHWLIQPFNLEGPPTYGPEQATLLHFVPGAGPGPRGNQPRLVPAQRKLRLRMKPGRVRASGRAVRFRASVTNGSGDPIEGASVRLAGRAADTNERGVAVLRMRMRSPGKYRARVTKAEMKPGRRTVHVVGRRGGARGAGAITPPPAA
jgi:hypothetical protein